MPHFISLIKNHQWVDISSDFRFFLKYCEIQAKNTQFFYSCSQCKACAEWINIMEFLHYTHKSCHNVEGKMCLWEQSWIQQGSRSIYKMAFIPWKNAAQDWLKCAPQSPLAIAPSLQPTKAETVNKQRNRQSHGHTFPHKC